MPKKQTASVAEPQQQWFVKELAGETPPSFEIMQDLYTLSANLYSLRFWDLLDDDNLIAVRDRITGELCYCSLMGTPGEILALHAYIGAEGLRQFRKMEDKETADPGEFFAFTPCVYVEFVARAELQRQDRAVLAALGHPRGKDRVAPIFRAMRPGFLPWFVTENEARTLAECIRSANVVCSVVAKQDNVKFWNRADFYPIVTRLEGDEPRFRVETIQSILPPEPPLAPARLDEETLLALRGRNYPVRGVMELDIAYSTAAVGKKGQRNASTAIAMAVDAESGLVLAPEVDESSVAAGETLAKVFLKAIQAGRTLPKEVRVRSQKLKDCLTPLMESLGIAVRVAPKLPALDHARSHLFDFFQKGM
jgi:hypothetical protein